MAAKPKIKKFFVHAEGMDTIDLEQDINILIEDGFELYGYSFYEPQSQLFKQPMLKTIPVDTDAKEAYLEFSNKHRGITKLPNDTPIYTRSDFEKLRIKNIISLIRLGKVSVIPIRRPPHLRGRKP